VQIHDGRIDRIDTGAPNNAPVATQFDGLKGHPLVAALNKLAELGYAPLQGAIDHGNTHTAAATIH